MPAQARSLRLTNALTLTSSVIGDWSAVSGPGLGTVLSVTAATNDVVVSWTGAQATAAVGRSWRLRLNGRDVIGGRVRGATPESTVGDQTVAVSVTASDVLTVTVVTAAAGPAGATGATGPTGATGATGAPGADGADAVYSDATPAALGTAAPGTADIAAREGHVHPMPTAQDVDAVPVASIGLLPGERNRGDWDNAATYAVGDVVHDHDGDGQMYVASASSTGEQPSLDLGSWTLADEMGRNITIGAGASADPNAGAAYGFLAEAGAAGTAIGAVTSAAGDYATGVGFLANASGLGGVAVGSGASAAGRASTAIGTQASANADGDVNVANIITGHIDPDTYEADEAIVVPGGGVDLAETTLATDPATDHQRIVARTDGIYVRDDTGAETGPLISAAPLDSGEHSGSVGLRSSTLEAWHGVLAGATAAAPVDVVVIGDSIMDMGTLTADPAPVALLARQLNAIAGVRSADTPGASSIPAAVHAQGDVTAMTATSTQGTRNATSLAAQGSTLTNTQVLTHTATATGFVVAYRTDPSYGTMTIRDGAGGTVLASINCAATAKSGNVWTSGALSDASHTLHITSTGTTCPEIIVPTYGTVVRVWPCSHQGDTSASFTSTPAKALDLIDTLDAAGTLGLVLVATGVNDSTYSTDVAALIAAVQAHTDATVALWFPYQCAAFPAAEYGPARTWAYASAGVPIIDASVVADQVETNDGTHPTANGKVLLATHLAAVLGGDPIGAAIRLASSPYIGRGSTTWRATEAGMTWSSDTFLGRLSAGTLVAGSPLSILMSAPDGVVWAGRRQTINAQTGTTYAPVAADAAKMITRSNASASTQKWPSDTTAAIPIGSIIQTLNIGAGTITHSAEASASLVTGSTTSQPQGKRITAYKIAANTWLLA